MENLKFLQTSPRLDKDEARTSASENGLEKNDSIATIGTAGACIIKLNCHSGQSMAVTSSIVQ